MPIAALPQTTIRAIGSTSVISDPCSVVKELIDNALDASASSLLIEISQNTVDVIQLKDNGHGISSEDYPYVSKRAFTSKIQTVDDLRNVGGASLGFRGEALASVADMSGSITITTRLGEEIAGSCLKYGSNGELTEIKRTSHPVGTTVRITDFLKHVPVRRQTALKSATKGLTKIKKLLQAYTMAQPSKKFSFKVLKARNESNNWMYTPRADSTLSDAALKVIGREIYSCCTLKRVSSRYNTEDEEGSHGKDYQLVAFLPKPATDFSKTNGAGQFVSVDGRPLSTSRGVGHDIVKLFKSYVRAAGSRSETSRSINDPFLCLQFKCPPGTYDVNIEPAKDDVLFEDREFVVSLAESLFRDHYGELVDSEKNAPVRDKEVSSVVPNPHGFELLMARKRVVEPTIQSGNSGNTSVDVSIASPLSQGRSCSQGSSPAEYPPSSEKVENNRGNRDSGFINPWSITSMNAPFRTPRRERIQPSGTSSRVLLDESPQESTRRTSRPNNGHCTLQNSHDLPSPPTSRFASTSPVNRGQRQRPPNESFFEANPGPGSSRRAARERDKERYGNGALDTWFQRTTQVSIRQNSSGDTPERSADVSPFPQLAQERFAPQTEGPENATQVDMQVREILDDVSEDERPRGSPLHDDTACSGRETYLPASTDRDRRFPVLENWASSLREGLNTEIDPGLERALEFERRKKEAMRIRRANSARHRKQPDFQQGPSSSHSPHHSRYLAAKAVLASEHNPPADPVSQTALSSDDPRAYLMRHQDNHRAAESSKDGTKSRRVHTSRLPFERIPERHDLHDLCLPWPTDLSLISESFKLTMQHDLYTQCENEVEAFSASHMKSLLPLWNQRLAVIINEQYRSKEESQLPEWHVDLSSAMAQHLEQFDAH